MSIVNIYAVGGTGINIGSAFLPYVGKAVDPVRGLAEVRTFFIDTSKSNLVGKDIPDNFIYIFDDEGKLLDGNGKERKSKNYDVIKDSSKMNSILHQFSPGDLNIVLHSSTGGSGSVIGPLLVSQLLARDKNVLVFCVGGTKSQIETDNTAKTLKSYENISANRKQPVCMMYLENSVTKPRSKVDKEMTGYINMSLAFWSGTNHGMDSSDLRNFLQYQKVTDFEPRLTALDFFVGPIKTPDRCTPVSVASLLADEDAEELNVLVGYHASGRCNAAVLENINGNDQMHMVTFSGYFQPIIKALEATLARYSEISSTSSNRGISSSDDDYNDEGLVL